MSNAFKSLGIEDAFIHKLNDMDIETPTAVQQRTIPPLLEGRDVIMRSQTGTGKTLAYLLPVLQRMNLLEGLKDLQAVVVVPTRELGMQVVSAAEQAAADHGLVVQGLIGGASLQRQIEKLRQHPQLVIGTPGRLLELIKLRKLKMHKVRTIVVDEADQVFALGAAGEVQEILQSAVRDKQVVFCSATMPEEMELKAKQWMRDPLAIVPEDNSLMPARIEHHFFVCEKRDKIELLRKLLRHYRPKAAMVFVNQTERIGELQAKLAHTGLTVDALYGDSHKAERTTVLHRFQQGRFQSLIATDVAARGLDLQGISHVFHFEPAADADHYLHRAGRTGRMGGAGVSISIVAADELFILRKFEKALDVRFIQHTLQNGKIVETSDAAASRGKPAVKSAAKKTTDRPSKPASGSNRDRQRDKKNKGAPRWLKEKEDS